MVRLYDKNMKYINVIPYIKDLKITEELRTGYKTAQFLAPFSIGLITEEQKIEIDNYIYVIKEVNMEQPDLYSVYCKPYFSDLLKKSVDYLTGYGMTFDDVMNELLYDTEWTYTGCIIGAHTININNKTVLESLEIISDLYNCFFKYNTKEKTIAAIPMESQDEPELSFTLTAANIQHCRVQSDTYDLVTKLIPIGKNLTTVQMVNDNSLAIENHQYTDEIIVGYYINSKIENADDLLQVATRKLDEISRPHASYKIYLNQFSVNLAIGDKIRIIDSIKGIDVIAYVKKIVRFPNENEQSYVELGDTFVSFDDIYKSFTSIQDSINVETLKNLTVLNKNM